MEEATNSHAIHHPVPAQWARSFFLALLPVLAVFLGGATSKWAEGIIIALFGAFLIFQPPRRSLGWKINATFADLCSLRAGELFAAVVVLRPRLADGSDERFRNRFAI